MFTVCHSLPARQPLPVDGFHEGHYKYGSMCESYSGSTIGFPPALSMDENGRSRVCTDCYEKEDRYLKVVIRAEGLMREVLRAGNAIPKINHQYCERTPSHAIDSFCWSLQTTAYFMEEYLAGGWEHPLYLAARSETLDEFEKALDAYEGKC